VGIRDKRLPLPVYWTIYESDRWVMVTILSNVVQSAAVVEENSRECSRSDPDTLAALEQWTKTVEC
jgi:hypothetical protein